MPLRYTEQAVLFRSRWSQHTVLIASNIRMRTAYETRSATVPVCRSRTQSFQENRPFIFRARVVLNPLVSLMGRLVACSARISVDRQTDRRTLAAHARRGLIIQANKSDLLSVYNVLTQSPSYMNMTPNCGAMNITQEGKTRTPKIIICPSV